MALRGSLLGGIFLTNVKVQILVTKSWLTVYEEIAWV